MAYKNIKDNSEIAKRLRFLRKKEDKNQTDFAKLLGVSLDGYQNYEQGKRTIPVSVVCSLYEKFQADPAWLLTGKHAHLASQDDAMIPIYNVSPAADSNTTSPHHEEMETLIAIDSSWLRQQTKVSPKFLVALEVTGHSMEPMMRRSDLAIIDTTDKSGDSICCLRYEDELVIKRVETQPNRWRLFSINEEYSPYEISRKELRNVEVIGKVALIVKKT